MKSVMAILIALALSGCATPSWDIFTPSDPDIASKLKLTDDEWRTIEVLASQEAGWVPHSILRRKKGVIEVDFRKASDLKGREGGIVRYYEKAGLSWRKVDYNGTWGYTLVPESDPSLTRRQ